MGKKADKIILILAAITHSLLCNYTLYYTILQCTKCNAMPDARNTGAADILEPTLPTNSVNCKHSFLDFGM